MTGLKDFENVSMHLQIIALQDLLSGRMSGWCSVSRYLVVTKHVINPHSVYFNPIARLFRKKKLTLAIVDMPKGGMRSSKSTASWRFHEGYLINHMVYINPSELNLFPADKCKNTLVIYP